MNEGKKFEKQFRNSLLKEGFMVVRLPDPPQSFDYLESKNNHLRFSNKNPYDLLVFNGENLYCLELKSVKGTSISFQNADDKSSKNIKYHQIKELTEASNYKKVIAGLVLNFRKKNKTYFLDIKNFNKFNENTDKKSINENDVINYNGILIPQKLLRSNYHYSFSEIGGDYENKIISKR